MRKVVFLRVGIDKGCGGILSPVFEDGTFELLWIPEGCNKSKGEQLSKEINQTYSNYIGRHRKPLIEYFPEGKRKEEYKNRIMHIDPEFKTFTYGDPSRSKSTLKNLNKGDFLIFYAGCQQLNKSKEQSALYIIGYFKIEKVRCVTDEKQYRFVKEEFGNNFHVKNKNIFLSNVRNSENNGLKLVKGGKGSRLLKKAYRMSVKEKYGKNNKPSDLLDPKLEKYFGDFNGKRSFVRNPLRWIKGEKQAEKAIKFIESLE